VNILIDRLRHACTRGMLDYLSRGREVKEVGSRLSNAFWLKSKWCLTLLMDQQTIDRNVCVVGAIGSIIDHILEGCSMSDGTASCCDQLRVEIGIRHDSEQGDRGSVCQQLFRQEFRSTSRLFSAKSSERIRKRSLETSSPSPLVQQSVFLTLRSLRKCHCRG
jgi:hypothetical protein